MISLTTSVSKKGETLNRANKTFRFLRPQNPQSSTNSRYWQSTQNKLCKFVSYINES